LTAQPLAIGELHPLQIGFASEHCVFPLKITSLNHTPSEVQVYVLSPEPLVEQGLFEKDLVGNYQWRTNWQSRQMEIYQQRRLREANLPDPRERVPTNLPDMLDLTEHN